MRITLDSLAGLAVTGAFPHAWRWFVAWTVFSALAVWLGLSMAEQRAADQCAAAGQSWNWTAWNCAQPRGTIVMPPELRRA